MKYFKITLLLISFFLVIACDNNDDDNSDDNCISTFIAPVEVVNAPDVGVVNMPITVTVSSAFTNGCQSFNKFITTGSGTMLSIELEVLSSGCICTLPIISYEKEYIFTPTEVGTYTLNFDSIDEEFITITIEVTN